MNPGILAKYVSSQLNNSFPDDYVVYPQDLVEDIRTTLADISSCWAAIDSKYYSDGFNHLNSDHYAYFLTRLARNLYVSDFQKNICEKLFYLNKSINGFDLFYEVDFPKLCFFDHPMGSVFGRAKYSDYIFVTQRCTIGANKSKYPTIGKYVSLHPGATILGDCNIGDNCVLAAGSLIIDMDLPDNKMYMGNPKGYVISDIPKDYKRVWKK